VDGGWMNALSCWRLLTVIPILYAGSALSNTVSCVPDGSGRNEQIVISGDAISRFPNILQFRLTYESQSIELSWNIAS